MFWSLLKNFARRLPCSQGLLQPACQALRLRQIAEFPALSAAASHRGGVWTVRWASKDGLRQSLDGEVLTY